MGKGRRRTNQEISGQTRAGEEGVREGYMGSALGR